MNRVLVLVEGDTELSFVDDILRPELETKGVFLSSTLFRKNTKGVLVIKIARNEYKIR